MIDGSMFLMRVNLKVDEAGMSYLLDEGWEEDVMSALREARMIGSKLPDQDEPIPAEQRSAIPRRRTCRPSERIGVKAKGKGMANNKPKKPKKHKRGK